MKDKSQIKLENKVKELEERITQLENITMKISKKTTYTVTRFDIEDGFYVEVSPKTDNEGKAMYEFFLCKDDYGIKDFMFGLYANDCPPNEWEGMIKANVDDYIEIFIDNMI